MYCAAVDAVDAEQFELVFAVEGDEVVVDETLLGEVVGVRDLVELETRAEVLLARGQRGDVVRVVLLQQGRGLGGGTLVALGRVGRLRVGQRLAVFARGHGSNKLYG